MNKVTKLQAIQILHDAFEAMPEYKKKWQNYIELIVGEELEEANIDLPLKKANRLSRAIGASVIRLFDPIWWEMQTHEDGK